MSLEATIASNTEAVRALTELLSRLNVPALVTTSAQPAQPAGNAQASTRARSTTTPAPTPPTVEAAPAAAPEPKDEPCAPVDYEQVKRALIALTAAQGREAVVDLLARYGVKTAKELKPDVYASIVAEAT